MVLFPMYKDNFVDSFPKEQLSSLLDSFHRSFIQVKTEIAK